MFNVLFLYSSGEKKKTVIIHTNPVTNHCIKKVIGNNHILINAILEIFLEGMLHTAIVKKFRRLTSTT